MFGAKVSVLFQIELIEIFGDEKFVQCDPIDTHSIEYYNKL